MGAGDPRAKGCVSCRFLEACALEERGLDGRPFDIVPSSCLEDCAPDVSSAGKEYLCGLGVRLGEDDC